MKRTWKRFCLLVCSFVMAICAAFAIVNIPTAQAKAETTDYDSGLTEVTMTQVNPINGVTQEGVTVDYLEFGGLDDDTWFMVDFYGRNVPNFAVNAVNAYSTWGSTGAAENYWMTRDKAGVLIAQTAETATGYAHTSLVLTNGLNTSRQYGAVSGTAGKGPGAGHLANDQRHVMIIGFDNPDNRSGSSYHIDLYYYLYSVSADGTLTKIHEFVYNKGVAAAKGTKAVIYPTIGINENNGWVSSKDQIAAGTQTWNGSVTFKYVRPADSLEGLINNIPEACAYKSQLLTEFEAEDVGLMTAKFDMVNPVDGKTVNGEYVDYISYDGFDNGTYFLVDFKDGNVPNFAVNATKAYRSWNAEDDSKAGLMLAQTYEVKNGEYTWGALKGSVGFTTYSDRAHIGGAAGVGPGMAFLRSGHYIMIIGTYTESYGGSNPQKRIQYYLFKVDDETKTVTHAKTLEAVQRTTLAKGDVAVIYPHMGCNPANGYVSTKKGITEGTQTWTSSITFQYANPAESLGALVNGLSNAYQYKDELQAYFQENAGITTTANTVTLQNMNGETIDTEVVYGKYVLPAVAGTSVIGYDVGGKLYQKGTTIEVSENITVKQVALNLALTQGASVRKIAGTNQYGGLRFQVTANADVMAAYGESIALKGVILPTDTIDGTFEINEAGSKSIDLTNCLTKDGVNAYYITLTNILYSNYNRNFSAKAYATVTYADGSQAVFETAYNETYARSIYAVAEEALAAGETDNSGVLANYVGYTVNVVKDGDTYALKDTTVTTYEISENVVTVKNIPANLLSAAVEGKLWIPVTVWEGDTATRTVVQATLDGATATFTLN